MEEHQKEYNQIEIITDDTNGLVELDTVKRYNQDRATKIRNNFVGHLFPAKAELLQQILEKLNPKLVSPDENELIVGLPTSGTIMAPALSLVRGTPYNFGIGHEFESKDTAFGFVEDERNKKPIYLYVLEKHHKVIIIEDEVTSGNGVIALTKAIREWGAEVVEIATVVETLNFGARDKVKEATGLDLKSLVQIELKQ
tara:strand:- start:3601 stop:4194 length:594 start_codon:yes stop_codon:yes gene_type:complete